LPLHGFLEKQEREKTGAISRLFFLIDILSGLKAEENINLFLAMEIHL